MLELGSKRSEREAAKNPDKKTRLLAALDRGMTMIHLDARRPGVAVPEHLKSEAHLLLNLSYRFTPPDLTVSEWGVRQTLTFGGASFQVAVPWSALYAISSHATKEFYMYPDDMPPELLASQPQSALRDVSLDPASLEAGEPPAEPEPPPAEPAKAAKEPPKRGHLRLVK